ncbi:MAG: carotenoid biosynthesis protein [Candidatus Dormibacteria bacterium]
MSVAQALLPLLGRWYAFGPWVLVGVIVWRCFGWRRAVLWLGVGWALAFAAEWSSTSGPGIPFGVYHYHPGGLSHDWTLLGVPLFDSLSFGWLAFCTYAVMGSLGARGWRRGLLGAVAMVAVDLVVDPVSLRGASWWLGSIYSYPAHSGVWYGVSLANYLGWLVLGAVLQLWTRLVLGEFPGQLPRPLLAAWPLLLGVLGWSSVLAGLLGVGPSAGAALLLFGICLTLARASRRRQLTGPPLILACALASEARAARHALGRGFSRLPSRRLVRWIGPDGGVEVWETGAGPAAARRAAAQAPLGGLVLVLGVAGACAPGWDLAEVGIGQSVLSPEGLWTELSPDARLALAGAGRSCRLATTYAVVDTPTQRSELAARGVDLVEMETSAWSDRQGARVAALRVVLDTPTSRLGRAATLIPPGGRGPDPRRLAGLLVRQPGALSELLAVGRLQARALAALSAAVGLAVPSLMDQRLPRPGSAGGESGPVAELG